jgi:hypothetical protein
VKLSARLVSHGLLVCMIAAALVATLEDRALAGDNSSKTAPTSSHDIIRRLVLANQARFDALRAYEGDRQYRIEYRGFPKTLAAEMTVRMKYRFPDVKEFTIVRESGSKLLLNRVLHRLLDSEKEASNEENRKQVALTLENYSFETSAAQADETQDIELNVKAKAKNKFLYNGRIWVNPKDYAVTRIEAEPAKNPSFWIKGTDITHAYTKVGDFWLPAHNQSVSRIRVGGRATLTIDYTNYHITDARPIQ